MERMTVIVTRRKRERLVPVLFYYSNDAEGPRWRWQPRSAGSYANIELEEECLLPQRRLAKQGSGVNAREKREGCLSSAVPQATGQTYGCTLPDSFSLIFSPLLCIQP